MSQDQELSFSQFFLSEFFNQICEGGKTRFSEDQYNNIELLISNLKTEEDFAQGIELLAREHETSELSIFLFDIMDRIMDYPPTLVHDSLQEMADDFVNTLEILFEETDTLSAITKINKKIISKIKKTSEEKPDLVEEKTFAESEKFEEEIGYREFVQKEFFQNVSDKLSSETNKDNSDKLQNFVGLIRKTANADELANAPKQLINLYNILKNVRVKDISTDVLTTELRGKINGLVPEFIENLNQLENENADLITMSVEGNQIVIPESIVTPVPEDIDDGKPSSIESLLSAYFQSEINDYLDIFRNGFDNIKNDPTSISALERLEKKFHSFKEISMIHGYEIVEKLCSRIIKILSEVRTKKYGMPVDFFEIADNLLDQLGQSEKYKGIANNSPEALHLDSLLNQFEETVDKTPQKTKPEKEMVDVETKDDITDEPEVEENIVFDDTSSMIEVIKELLNDIQPLIKIELVENKNFETAIKVFDKILKSALLINHDAISIFCQQYAIRLEQLHSLDESTLQTAADEISELLLLIIPQISPDFNDHDWQEKIAKFDNIIEPNYAIEDSSSLLSVLIEIEDANLSNFRESLEKIANEQNIGEKSQQHYHFYRLNENFKLLGQTNLLSFSEYFMSLFDDQASFMFPEDIISEIAQSYKLFIETIKNNGEVANTDDIYQVLSELIDEHQKSDIEVDEESSEIVEEEFKKEVTEDFETADEEVVVDEDEDLNQIFNDEAKKFIWKIEDALALYDVNEPNNDLFSEIEKNIHSLKSSARLMGIDDIADTSGKVEEIAEYFYSNKIAINKSDFDIIKESITCLKDYVDDDSKSLIDVDSKLDLFVEKLKTQALEKESSEDQEEAKTKDDEKPLFASDEDNEMLEIFKDESSTYINIIENTIESLQHGGKNPEEIHQFEYASHSLKSAAKMLGFREIGQIADGLEQFAEALNKNEIIHDAEIHKILVKSIDYVKSLSEGNKLPSTEIAEILNQLEISKILDRQKESVDFAELQAESTERVDLDPMIDLFLKEVWELLEKINQDLVKLEKKHDNDLLKNLNRNVHTLKGSAQMMQFEKISLISHSIEDFFEKHQDDKKAIPREALNHIFEAFDEIQEMIKSIKSGTGEISSNYEKVMANLGIDVSTETEPEIEKEEKLETIEKPKINIQAATALPDDENQQLVKISTDRLDNLVNLAAELVINKTQLMNYIGSLKKLGIDLDKDRITFKNANYSLNDIIYKSKLDISDSEEIPDIAENLESNYGNLSLISEDYKQTLGTIDLVYSQFNSLTQGFEQNINRIAHLIKMLHDDILQVRMLPTENLFNRFPRVVRDLAYQQEKKVDLLIEGEETEMDRALIESLTNPLMHLVRNAIDHGIEIPEDRKQQGKKENGTILLKAHQDKNQIIVEVQDDGRGINFEAVKDVIVKNSLADHEKVAKMSQVEVLDYIFSPGFSTKDETTSVSGRGIGLDVVADQVQNLKGDIRVNSTLGKGTVFTIRVPLTLIISQVLLLRLGDQVLGVPLISVEETIQFDISSITVKEDKKFIDFRNESIPVFDLNEILNFSNQIKQNEVQAILIQETGIRYALIVDEVIRREEIVIKSLGTHLHNLEYISGGTILGDGTIALLIDTSAFVRKVEKENQKRSKGISTISGSKKTIEKKIEEKTEVVQKPEQKKKPKKEEKSKKEQKKVTEQVDKKRISDQKPTALIVDDSISVRRFVATVLEKNNYSTVLASNGINALACLEKSSFDLVVTDLEMPKMHGFELIEKIRAQEKYKDLPIVILTGRAGKKHKEMGADVGANAFIVKPFKETDLLKTLKKFIAI